MADRNDPPPDDDRLGAILFWLGILLWFGTMIACGVWGYLRWGNLW